jgi:cyclin C
MQLKAVPLGTATVFFKRFYIKNAICETNPFLVLAACIFVAAKVEETPVHIKTVVAEARYIFSGMLALYILPSGYPTVAQLL